MTKNIHATEHHFGWDNSIAPKMVVQPGEEVFVETLDSSAGQITKDSKLPDLINLDFGKVNPVTGPILVQGAKPGDAVQITFLEFHTKGWGWTGNIPGFGLLADQFKDPALHIWKLAEKGLHSVVPPRNVGGNLDIRDMAAGTVLRLPVEVDGALLSIGDTHAAQGDGEVCGTAIESPIDVLVKIDLIKDAKISSPEFETSSAVTKHIDSAGYLVTTGVGPDLMVGAREAVSRMIDLLVKRHKITPMQAYMLCSVAGDLRISEIVDMPNWVVSFYFPKSIHQ
jgi:acetamidase/formamidase